jgi:hypothetical protein
MKNIDFSRRNNLSQLMNSDDADFETFRACLIDLAKVNYLTLAYRPTLRFFEHLARSGRLPRDRSITVIDVEPLGWDPEGPPLARSPAQFL